MTGWAERRHPVEMTSDELEEAKSHLLRWHSHHAAELRRLEQQVAHVDMVILERFHMPMPEGITPTDPWGPHGSDLEDPPVAPEPEPEPPREDGL